MNHVLTVGEIYDKAVDLCLRNSGRIVSTLGAYFLATSTFGVLQSSYRGSVILTAMHVPPRDPILHGGWITALDFVDYVIVLPIVGAALFVLFDRSLSGKDIQLSEFLRSEPRRTANVVLASLLCNLIGIVALIPIGIAGVLGFAGARLPILLVVSEVAGAALVLLFTAVLVLGAAVGFARVALNAGRVFQSLVFGMAVAFAKINCLRAISVGVPLLFVLFVGTIGCIYAGIEMFVLTGSYAADILVQSIGSVVAYSLLAAVATVYYRSLEPAA